MIMADTTNVKLAAGPETLKCDPLNCPTTIPPMIPAIMPEKIGVPDASAMPTQSGSATSSTTMDAERLLPRCVYNFFMYCN
jgi:hypothetical protein